MWIALTTESPSPVELDRSRKRFADIGFPSGTEVGVGGGVDVEVGSAVA